MRLGERRSSASPERDVRIFRYGGTIRVYRATFEAAREAHQAGRSIDVMEADLAATCALVSLSGICCVHAIRGIAARIEPPRKD